MISLSASEKSTDRDFKYADDPIHMHNVPRSFCSSLFNFYNLIVWCVLSIISLLAIILSIIVVQSIQFSTIFHDNSLISHIAQIWELNNLRLSFYRPSAILPSKTALSCYIHRTISWSPFGFFKNLLLSISILFHVLSSFRVFCVNLSLFDVLTYHLPPSSPSSLLPIYFFQFQNWVERRDV